VQKIASIFRFIIIENGMPYYGDVSLGARIREMTQKRFDERAFGVGGIVGRLSFLS
jgi:hypothetical protein